MVIPRRRSSGRRSASIPVSARRSAVLPWSIWPAVPTTTVIAAAFGSSSDQGRNRLPKGRVVGRVDRAQVEEQVVVRDPRDNAWIATAELGQQPADGPGPDGQPE